MIFILDPGEIGFDEPIYLFIYRPAAPARGRGLLGGLAGLLLCLLCLATLGLLGLFATFIAVTKYLGKDF